MKILVCGSRDWTERETIRAWLRKFPRGSTVIHGAARGADTIAGEEARALGFTVRAYPADWTTNGKAAGPIRNQRMLDEEHLRGTTIGGVALPFQPFDRCLAFTWVLRKEEQSGRVTGTGDMVIRCVTAGIVATIVPPGKLP